MRVNATDLDEYAGSGNCYPFANAFIRSLPKDTNATLVHGTGYNTLLDRSFPHAWVELDGKVYDNIFTEGIDQAEWEEYLIPKDKTNYTQRESIRNMLSTGHHGPWN